MQQQCGLLTTYLLAERLGYGYTHRRSIAKRGGCFQRRLFVCLFVCHCVCLFVRTVTSERLNTGRSNLSVRYAVQKSRPSSKVKSKVKDQGHHGQKRRKTVESSPLTMHSKVCAVGGTQQAATDDTIASPLRGDRLRRWKNQRMLSSLVMF